MKWYNNLYFRLMLLTVAFGLSIWAFFISWKAALMVGISWYMCNIIDNVLKPKS